MEWRVIYYVVPKAKLNIELSITYLVYVFFRDIRKRAAASCVN